jgi:hypothetical protein
MIVDKRKGISREYGAGKNGRKYRILPIGLAILALFASLVIRIGGKEYSLKEEEKLLKKQLESYDDAEQYALIALESAWYSCCNCPREEVFLLSGEVWKYGSTIGKNRYSVEQLQDWKVQYMVEFRGDLTACRKEEIRKIRMYKFSVENLKRPIFKRLVRPSGNCKNY